MLKIILFFMAGFLLFSSRIESSDVAVDLRSTLNKSVDLPEFGEIRYRAPLENNTGFPIVLFHGTYVGVSHRAYREILPLLDQAGARVWVMDLPGCGDSDKPKRTYDIATFDRFIESFLKEVVKEPAIAFGQYILSQSVLAVSKKRPELFRGVMVMSPTGVRRYSSPPSETDRQLYAHLLKNEYAGRAFFKHLFNEYALNFLLKNSFANDGRISVIHRAERTLASENVDQRWVTLSYSTGHLYRTFEENAKGQRVPIRMIFGKKAEGPLVHPKDRDRARDFQKIQPHFDYVEVEDSGHAIHKEQPGVLAARILEFADQATRFRRNFAQQ